MEALKIKDQKSTMALLREKFKQAMSYREFRTLVDQLATDGKTTGIDQNESLINYTLLNSRRMKRWDRTFKLDDTSREMISKIDSKIHFLVLTESWCGDAAPSLPVMNQISEQNPNIKLKIILRDEHLDLMDRFRTEGTLSIPKLIAFEANTGQVLGEWGPRPGTATKIASEFKHKNGSLTPEFKEDLQRWYNEDKGRDTLQDMLRLLALK